MATAIEARERPILFSGAMVRAILRGRKTQTRRVIKCRDPRWEVTDEGDGSGRLWPYWPCYVTSEPQAIEIPCPFGGPGDRLWVRETWTPIPAMKPSGYFTDPNWIDRTCWYAADNDRPTWGGKWRPSIFMPRSESRITLQVTDVRVERLQEISEEDAIAEGAQCAGFPASLTNRGAFAKLWDKLNGPRGFGWESNPWVWVIQFAVIPPEKGSGEEAR